MPKPPIDLDLLFGEMLKGLENILDPETQKKATSMTGGRIRPEGNASFTYQSAGASRPSTDQLSLVDSKGNVVGRLSKDFVLEQLLKKQ